MFVFIQQAHVFESASSATTSRTLHHCRCCSWNDASRTCSRVPIVISYSQTSLHPGVLLFDETQLISMYPFAHQDGVRTTHFSTATTTLTSTSVTLASRGYHLHVVLFGFYFSHSIRIITMLQLWGDVSSSDSTSNLFSSFIICGVLVVTTEDVRVYLVGYICCIINYYICWNIFGRIYIMYHILPYVFRSALPLKILIVSNYIDKTH
jgi:hypothetical protein